MLDVSLQSLPPLFFVVGEGESPGPAPAAEVVGHDSATWLVVRPDGSVASIDPEGSLPTRFVASTKGEFAHVLREFGPRWQALADMSEQQAEAAAQRLVRDIETDHPAVVRDAEAWWSVVLEQVSAGLL